MYTTNLYDNSPLYAAKARGGPDVMPRGRGWTKQKEKKKHKTKGCLKGEETNSDAAEIL